jgi:hypothetical protein
MGLTKVINKGHYVTTKRGFIHTVVLVEYNPMTRRTTVSSLKVLLLLSIIMIIFSSNTSAADTDFDISVDNTWSVEYLDGSTLEKTGNNSASDGDFISLKIQVFNTNLSSEDAYWSFSFGFDGQWYGGNSGVLIGNLSTNDIEISFGPVTEGYVLCKLEVDNTLENEVHEIRVGPNPVNFSSAGSNEIVIIGQPIHVGDELTASILVHNQGSISDSVRLELTRDDGTTLVNGEFISISPGSSREVSANFIPLLSGSLNVDWRISSLNGGVDVSLNGSSDIEVRNSQDIIVELEEISWDLEEGLDLDISISLSSGLNRSMGVEIFMKSGNEYAEFQKFNIEMNPGIRNINLNLGHPDASRLKIVVSPNSWLPLNGDGELIIELIPPLVTPSILISGMSPTTVSLGDTFTISYSLENTGTSASSAGLLRVVGVANNLVFTEVSVPSIDPGNDYSGAVEFISWEYSQTIDIEFIWNMEDLIVKNQTSVVVDSGSSASFSLPFSIYAAIYGALSGLAIVMTSLVIFRAISQRTPSTNSKLFRGDFLNNRFLKNNASKLKKEVSCPSCNQRLNIPIEHNGSVKCPACSMQFSQKSFTQDEIEDSMSVEKPDDETIISEYEALSSTDLLSCPKCEQTLRVALDKRPVRSRCPACRVEFIAKIG